MLWDSETGSINVWPISEHFTAMWAAYDALERLVHCRHQGGLEREADHLTDLVVSWQMGL